MRDSLTVFRNRNSKPKALPCHAKSFFSISLRAIIAVQNRFFTAEPQSTQRRGFYLAGRYRQIKRSPFLKTMLRAGTGVIERIGLQPERAEFLIQSSPPACADEAATARRRPDWIRKTFTQRSLRLCGENILRGGSYAKRTGY